MTIGEFLRKKRKEKGFSLRQLSYKVGVSHTNIADVEKGIVNKEWTILKIIAGLGLDEKEKQMALKLIEKDDVPENLKDELFDLKKALVIQNNSNIGDIVVGKNEKNYINTDIDLSGLDELDIQNIKNYIAFLKTQKLTQK